MPVLPWNSVVIHRFLPAYRQSAELRPDEYCKSLAPDQAVVLLPAGFGQLAGSSLVMGLNQINLGNRN